MPRVLFVVHGMGVHGQDWATHTLGHLADLPNAYQYQHFADEGSLTDHVTLVPISYDDAFIDILADWNDEASRLAEFADASGVGVARLVNFLSACSETENNFFWSHVVDVLLYRFFQIVAARVRLLVRQKIVTEMTEAAENGRVVNAYVMAHSLGTAVTHDSLALLATQPIDTPHGPNRAFMLGNARIERLFMVANVSRILETRPKVFESAIHPSTINPATSYTRVYCNFRHRFDPFPAFRPFNPQGWGEDYVAVENCRHVLEFNVHDLDHYLEDPRVHITVLRQMLGSHVVTREEELAAIAEYDATVGPNCASTVAGFKQTVDQLMAEFSGVTDPEDIVIGFTKALAVAKEASDACD